MTLTDINKIINSIKGYFPEDASEIVDALELLNLALDGLLGSASKQIVEFHTNKEYDQGMELLELSKSVSEIQEIINDFSILMNTETEKEEEGSEEEPDEAEEQRTIPNYSEYVVDSSIPHTLYEDFTHKKAAAFLLNNMRYPARDWKDVLLQTCDLLAEIDSGKFLEFVNDPVMKGRKISYFSEKHVDGKNVKMADIDIYVWTNLSANNIRNLIRKMLKKFNIRITDYYIFLRADYTHLHKNEKVKDDSNSMQRDHHNAEKIGRYVRQSLRELSNRQHSFTDQELISMTSKEWSKDILGIDYPLFRKYKEDEDISVQVRDGIYGRYWKEIIEFNGMKFLVTSQWYERHRESFRRWIERL